MRMCIVPVVLILCAVVLSPAPESALVVHDEAAAEAEFDALRQQAIAALESLRHASEHRAAPAQRAAF